MYFIDDFQFSACPTEDNTKREIFRNDFFDYHYHALCDKAEEISLTKKLRANFSQPSGIKDYGY